MNKTMKHLGMVLFTIGLMLTFGATAFLDYKAWLLVIGSSMYAAGVEMIAKCERVS